MCGPKERRRLMALSYRVSGLDVRDSGCSLEGRSFRLYRTECCIGY